MKETEINILLVEDEKADSFLFQSALEKLNYPINLNIINNSVIAYEYLNTYKFDKGFFKDKRKEDIIFLDINMPNISGIDILNLLKSDNDLKTIPVVMLSSFESYLDIKDCYSKGANGCVSKPLKLKEYTKMLDNTIRFWTETTKVKAWNH